MPRRTQVRNPHHLGLMAALVAIPGLQLLLGPKGSPVVLAMPDLGQRTFAILLLISAVSVLISAVWPEFPTRSWMPAGAHFEFGGQMGVALALAVYVATLKASNPFWYTSLGIIFAFVGAASLWRAVVVVLFIRRNFYVKIPG